MKYTVGLNAAVPEFLDCILENRQHIHEVYFSWGDLPNGRSNQLEKAGFTPWQLQDMQRAALSALSAGGVGLNLLFNANCYGEEAQARSFFHQVGTIIDHVGEAYSLRSVTTTSPLIAKFIKNNFFTNVYIHFNFITVNYATGTYCNNFGQLGLFLYC